MQTDSYSIFTCDRFTLTIYGKRNDKNARSSRITNRQDSKSRTVPTKSIQYFFSIGYIKITVSQTNNFIIINTHTNKSIQTMKFNLALVSVLIASAMAAPMPDATEAPTATNGPLIVNGFAMPSASATDFAPAPNVTAIGSITIIGTPTHSAGFHLAPSSKTYFTAATIGLLIPASASLFL
jgi:hypothetical protein